MRGLLRPRSRPAQATFDTGYALALYMERLAAAGSAPTQADIDEAARVYFTNGAAATGVPTSGPRAAYSKHGASVTPAPRGGAGAAWFHDGAGVLAYRAVPASPPAPPSPPAEAPAVDAGGTEAVAPARPNASAPPAAPPPAVSPAPPAGAGPSGPTCSSQELETALAIGKEYALASPTAGPAAPPVTEAAPVAAPPPRAAPAPTVVPAAPSACASETPWTRIVPSIAGALLAVAGAMFWLGAHAAVRHGPSGPRAG